MVNSDLRQITLVKPVLIILLLKLTSLTLLIFLRFKHQEVEDYYLLVNPSLPLEWFQSQVESKDKSILVKFKL